MSGIPSPFGGQNRIKLSFREYKNAFLILFLMLFLIFLYVIEFPYFSNTFQIESLIVRSLLFFLPIGIGLGYLFSKKAKDATDKLQVYVFFIIFSLILAPLFGSLSNRLFSFSDPKKMEFELEQQSTYMASRFGKLEDQENDGYYIMFYKDQKLERIKTKNLIFLEAEKGDRISIPIKKGFWGYEYFVEE